MYYFFQVFGRPFAALCQDLSVSDPDNVPKFLKQFCLYLLQPMHVSQVGLFRVSGM